MVDVCPQVLQTPHEADLIAGFPTSDQEELFGWTLGQGQEVDRLQLVGEHRRHRESHDLLAAIQVHLVAAGLGLTVQEAGVPRAQLGHVILAGYRRLPHHHAVDIRTPGRDQGSQARAKANPNQRQRLLGTAPSNLCNRVPDVVNPVPEGDVLTTPGRIPGPEVVESQRGEAGTTQPRGELTAATEAVDILVSERVADDDAVAVGGISVRCVVRAKQLSASRSKKVWLHDPTHRLQESCHVLAGRWTLGAGRGEMGGFSV